ncbi:hypothetical protein PHYBLDRAFT_68910 [Phycomyces blakesleeanus NRRL 1555(-)]|uniref:Uncharacterized protein n=1 Tax=Phycomyces blakesleeanus (strain ATCC 8743b / DSM 1359 / FGSC 10004 / NBRC 33097 / NRRL 1555) TaxID=763407 RepID=A0A162N470_PHYB8|nr:hypothetical protein PHYBLDRAFT_68910 [Phycomyces blakesleeanus NRRL 1555(-)]OAD68358.1 hypothetical protein PHYBLDRAFT_68910 [Phycomyces blakesleeanus NRRL 1555(-)]|eukprot:XP_018286398.1 hypothetical protein PHYBLDRAFT_68910 [Phycomyces blakesleeanus NRRL 1555(-)]
MKEILINDPSVYSQNFGQSRTSRLTSMSTTSKKKIEVLLEAVVSNNINDDHASNLNPVISNNKNEESLTATLLLTERSDYLASVNKILSTITYLHKETQDEVATERDVFISQLLETHEQRAAKQARDEKDRELIHKFTKACINELQHRQLQDNVILAEQKQLNDFLAQFLQSRYNNNQ